jgi:hypothetical protein
MYIPDKDDEQTGGVGLPKITAFNVKTLKETACPPRHEGDVVIPSSVQSLPPFPQEGLIRFFASKGASFFANKDTHYVVGNLDFRQGEVAIVRMKVPSWFDNSDPAGIFNAKTDVRYWSMCLSGVPSTATSDCLFDKETIVGHSGWVTIVVGPRPLGPMVKAHHLNFMARGMLDGPLLIYRHMMTQEGFVGDFAKVPTWPQPPEAPFHTIEQLDARQFVGDYAPRGRHCTPEELTADLEAGHSTACGVEID